MQTSEGRRQFRYRARAAAVLVAAPLLALSLIGCGGDDDGRCQYDFTTEEVMSMNPNESNIIAACNELAERPKLGVRARDDVLIEWLDAIGRHGRRSERERSQGADGATVDPPHRATLTEPMRHYKPYDRPITSSMISSVPAPIRLSRRSRHARSILYSRM